MALPIDIYQIIHPTRQVILDSGFDEGWGADLALKPVFFLASLRRIMSTVETIYAVDLNAKGQVISQGEFEKKYRHELQHGYDRRNPVQYDGERVVKRLFQDAFAHIPTEWKKHEDFKGFDWKDDNLSRLQVEKAIAGEPLTFVKCCHVLALIDLLLEIERKAAGAAADPRLATFELSDATLGIRIMPAVFRIRGFDEDFCQNNLPKPGNGTHRFGSLAQHVGTKDSQFWEHLQNGLTATYRNLEKVQEFLANNTRREIGPIEAIVPKRKSASGEKAIFP